ncbi:MAG: right-handed parallel beta-helix repeat-containing protein, partial [Planctomycetaceae bacterium]
MPDGLQSPTPLMLVITCRREPTRETPASVASASVSRVGSLRQVMTNINGVGDCNPSGMDAEIAIDIAQAVVMSASPVVFQLMSQLPAVGAMVTIDGTASGMVLDGGTTVSNGFTFTDSASGSVLRGVTLQNFANFAIQIIGARAIAMTIDTIVVQGLNTSTSMGLYATGDVTGTRVLGSTFSGGLRGALLDGARGLIFGEIGRGTTLANNRATPSQPKHAGTGIRAQGDCMDTVVRGNTFNVNNYGFAFMAARGLALDGNLFTRNGIAAIYIEGDSSGSTQSGNQFGRGRDRNKADVRRASKSKFGILSPQTSRPPR